MIHVCFCFTDNTGTYYRHPLVAFSSILENTKSPVCVHLICDETVSKSAKDAFVQLAERYGHGSVCFYSAPDIPQPVLDNVRGRFGKGTLFRLFIPELIPADKVLYLDCDIVCTLDIKELFDWDIGALPIAGVFDLDGDENYLKKLGLIPKRCINAGVMLMDLKKIRHNHPGFRETTFAFLAAGKMAYLDQDALNRYFQNEGYTIDILPKHYNYFCGGSDRAHRDLKSYSGKILHFTEDKPWNTLYPAALFYWHYYAKVFSHEASFEAMLHLDRHKHSHLYNFILRNAKMRRMLNRIYEVTRQGLVKTVFDRIFPSRRKKKR